MLDPQEVRKRRKEALHQLSVKKRAELIEEAKKIFQWILEMIDTNTLEGRFYNFSIWQYDRSSKITTTTEEYNLSSFSRDEIFPILCDIINKEEGYHAEYEKNVVIYNETAWELSVTIE